VHILIICTSLLVHESFHEHVHMYCVRIIFGRNSHIFTECSVDGSNILFSDTLQLHV